MPNVMALFDNGSDRFFNKAESGRWRDICRSEDLALYENQAAKQEPAFASWLAGGRHIAGDPQQAAQCPSRIVSAISMPKPERPT
jgi:hypothetical protein